MRLTVKGQVTIPKKYRQRYNLTPHTEVVFEENPHGLIIRPASDNRAEDLKKALAELSGIADTPFSTDDIMRQTREV